MLYSECVMLFSDYIMMYIVCGMLCSDLVMLYSDWVILYSDCVMLCSVSHSYCL